MSLKSKLKKLKKGWKEAGKREDGGFENPVDDGVYMMQITVAELGESQAGRLQIHWGYTVLEGEYAGETVHDWDGLESENNLFHVQRKLARLGYDVPDDPSELEDVIVAIAEAQPVVKGKVKTKDEFTHVYVNKLITAEGGPVPEKGSDSEEADTDEDDTEEISLAEGMRVSLTWKGDACEGEILEFTDDDTKARVQIDDGPKVRLAVEKLDPLEDEDTPEEPDEDEEEEDEDEPEDVDVEEDEDDDEEEEEPDEDEDEDEDEEEEDEPPVKPVKKKAKKQEKKKPAKKDKKKSKKKKETKKPTKKKKTKKKK